MLDFGYQVLLLTARDIRPPHDSVYKPRWRCELYAWLKTGPTACACVRTCCGCCCHHSALCVLREDWVVGRRSTNIITPKNKTLGGDNCTATCRPSWAIAATLVRYKLFCVSSCDPLSKASIQHDSAMKCPATNTWVPLPRALPVMGRRCMMGLDK